MSAESQNEPREAGRRMVYCILPRNLASSLHDTLRSHFAEEPGVEVVVERRDAERRVDDERRRDEADETVAERRRVRNRAGRRIAERRATAVPVDALPLPRKARRHAERLVFVERLEPSSEKLEDADTARLVARLQSGERELFATLYMRYFDRVYNYLHVVLRQQHDAEDATQQVFIKVLEALPGYEQRGRPFRAWLFTVARNHALDQLERAGRFESLEPHSRALREEHRTTSDEHLMALSWISDRELTMFFERLPLAQRQVLMLRYVIGLSVAETADVLGRNAEAVRKLQSRGLAFLRQRLKAVGRMPEHNERRRSGRYFRQARVLRARQFMLISPGPVR